MGLTQLYLGTCRGTARSHVGGLRFPTSGKRKGYKIFGLIDYFSGRFFYKSQQGRFNSESYAAFLLDVLGQTRRHVVVIQDGARYHTSAAMKVLFKTHATRLTIEQLPSYSPDFNPIEHLWKKVKKEATHLKYFPDFSHLQPEVGVGPTFA